MSTNGSPTPEQLGVRRLLRLPPGRHCKGHEMAEAKTICDALDCALPPHRPQGRRPRLRRPTSSGSTPSPARAASATFWSRTSATTCPPKMREAVRLRRQERLRPRRIRSSSPHEVLGGLPESSTSTSTNSLPALSTTTSPAPPMSTPSIYRRSATARQKALHGEGQRPPRRRHQRP